MNVIFEKISNIDTSDILYDMNLKQFCIYPKDGSQNFDLEYIKKNCLKLTVNT